MGPVAANRPTSYSKWTDSVQAAEGVVDFVASPNDPMTSAERIGVATCRRIVRGRLLSSTPWIILFIDLVVLIRSIFGSIGIDLLSLEIPEQVADTLQVVNIRLRLFGSRQSQIASSFDFVDSIDVQATRIGRICAARNSLSAADTAASAACKLRLNWRSRASNSISCNCNSRRIRARFALSCLNSEVGSARFSTSFSSCLSRSRVVFALICEEESCRASSKRRAIVGLDALGS